MGVLTPSDSLWDPTLHRLLTRDEIETLITAELYKMASFCLLEISLKSCRASDLATAMLYYIRSALKCVPAWTSDLTTMTLVDPRSPAVGELLATFDRLLTPLRVPQTPPLGVFDALRPGLHINSEQHLPQVYAGSDQVGLADTPLREDTTPTFYHSPVPSSLPYAPSSSSLRLHTTPLPGPVQSTTPLAGPAPYPHRLDPAASPADIASGVLSPIMSSASYTAGDSRGFSYYHRDEAEDLRGDRDAHHNNVNKENQFLNKRVNVTSTLSIPVEQLNSMAI